MRSDVHRQVATSQTDTDPTGAAFLRDFTHELRSPLNAIIGFSELLKQRSFGDLNEKQSRYVEHIIVAARKELELIATIVELAGFESARATEEPERVPVSVLIEETYRLIRQKSHKQSVLLSTEGDALGLAVVAVRNSLSQVLYHLVHAGLEALPHGGRITVIATKEDTRLRLEVCCSAGEGAATPAASPIRLAPWRADIIGRILAREGAEVKGADGTSQGAAIRLLLDAPET